VIYFKRIDDLQIYLICHILKIFIYLLIYSFIYLIILYTFIIIFFIFLSIYLLIYTFIYFKYNCIIIFYGVIKKFYKPLKINGVLKICILKIGEMNRIHK